MKFLVITSALCFFQGLASAAEKSGTSKDELPLDTNRLAISVEELAPDVHNIQAKTDSESKIVLEEETDDLTFRFLGKKTTLDQFLKEQLSEEEISEGAVVPVLRALEDWLERETSPATTFAKFVRLCDPNLEHEKQKSRAGAFRTECLLELVELAEKFKLDALLATLAHPLNAPREPEMCPHVLRASHYFKFGDKDSCSEYLQLLRDAGCLDDLNRFIKQVSLRAIESVHKCQKLTEVFKGKQEMPEVFIRANDLEKLQWLHDCTDFGGVFDQPDAIKFACQHGSYKLLNSIFEFYPHIDKDSRQECANASPNIETLEWVYTKFKVLPNNKKILKLCLHGELAMVEYIYSIEPGSLNNRRLVDEALESKQWKIVKFLIDKFPALIDTEDQSYLGAPFEIFQVLESKGKIHKTFATTERLLYAIGFRYSGLIEWVSENSISAPKKLSKDENFRGYISDAIFWGDLEYLKLIWKLVSFDITLDYLKGALRMGRIDVLKFLVQELENLQDLPPDDYLINLFSGNKNLFADFLSVCFPQRIVLSGNMAVVKYLMGKFPQLGLQRHMDEAVESGSLSMIEYFFELEPENYPSYLAIQKAVVHGHIEAVKWTLNKITDRQWQDKLRKDFSLQIKELKDRSLVRKIKRIFKKNGVIN